MAMAAYIIGMQKIASLASPKTELLSRDFLSSSRMTSNSEVVPGLFGLPVNVLVIVRSTRLLFLRVLLQHSQTLSELVRLYGYLFTDFLQRVLIHSATH
jgi:hypothetical protein